MRNQLWLCVISVLLMNCQAEQLPEDKLEDAEIFFHGKLSNEKVIWIAGEDSLYNFTSHSLNDQQFYQFTSKMGYVHRPEAHPYIEIIIFDKSMPGDPTPSENRYVPGPRDVMHQSELISSNTFQFSPEFNGFDNDHYHWNLGSFGNSHLSHPTAELKGSGSEMICLTAGTNAGDTVFMCKRIPMTSENIYQPIIKISAVRSDSVELSAGMKHIICDQWTWDGISGNSETNTWALQDLEDTSAHHVSLSKNNLPLCQAQFLIIKDPTSGEVVLRSIDFVSTKIGQQIQDELQYGKAIVNYYSEENGFYSSSFANSGQSGTFFIQRNSFFRNNEEGVPTRKLSFNFDLILATEFGDSINLSTEESIMAFPNP